MTKNILFPITLIALAYGFWSSPNFKEISAGIAIFLFGMLSLEQGFKSFSGGVLNKILKNSTDKLYKSIGFGAILTSIVQSSSLVSVLTISFLGAGLLTLTQAIGVVFGANLGTTTGAWLVAIYGLKVDIGSYALPMLVFGIVFIFQKSNSLKGIGYILTGLGFLFLGIAYMKDGFEVFKETIDLSAYAVGGLKGVLLFTLAGVFATVVMQSSHATLVLIITALAANQINYENALALTIGANVGTTITSIIAATSSNIEGKRLVGGYIVYKLVTGFIAIAFLNQIMFLIDFTALKFGIAADDYTLKLAMFHTLINIIGVSIMVPFIGKLVDFLEKYLKEKKSPDEIGYDTVIYLNDSVLEFPQSAIGALERETKHLYENAFEVISHGMNLQRRMIDSQMQLEEVIKHTHAKKYIDVEDFYEKRIKDIYSEIILFSTKAQINMSPEGIEKLYKLKLASRNIVGAVKNTKHLQKNILKFSAHPNQFIKKEYAFIKLSLAELLRNINIIATSEDKELINEILLKVRENTQNYDVFSNGKLDELIRNKQITNQMATSLMNDSVYVNNIRNKLCNMAEVLFIQEESGLRDVENEDELI